MPGSDFLVRKLDAPGCELHVIPAIEAGPHGRSINADAYRIIGPIEVRAEDLEQSVVRIWEAEDAPSGVRAGETATILDFIRTAGCRFVPSSPGDHAGQGDSS